MQNQLNEQELDLKDLFFYILFHWRFLFISVIALFVVMAGYSRIAGMSNEVLDSELVDSYNQQVQEYNDKKSTYEAIIENLQNNIDEQEKYMKDSILMQLNPFNVGVSSADILIQLEDSKDDSELLSLMEAYFYFILNDNFLNDMAQQLQVDPGYLKELIHIDVGSGWQRYEFKDDQKVSRQYTFDGYYNSDKAEKGILHLSVAYKTENDASEIVNKILDNIQKYQLELNQKISLHKLEIINLNQSTTVDDRLMSLQQEAKINYTSLENLLESYQKKCKELKMPEALDNSKAVLSLKYLVLYCFVLIFIVVLILCLKYLVSDKVKDGKELEKRVGLRNIGSFSMPPSKRLFGFIDNWLRKLAGYYVISEDSVVYKIIAANIKHHIKSKSTLLVTGTISEEYLQQVVKQIQLDITDITVVAGKSMLEEGSTIEMLTEHENVLLVEKRGKSKFSQIQHELELINQAGSQAIGFIML